MYAEDWTKCEKLARRISASAPHNASVIGDPAEDWTGGGSISTPIQLGANGQRKKNTRMAFGTINIGAHAKMRTKGRIVSQPFQDVSQPF